MADKGINPMDILLAIALLLALAFVIFTQDDRGPF
jgi:hypothetical protein